MDDLNPEAQRILRIHNMFGPPTRITILTGPFNNNTYDYILYRVAPEGLYQVLAKYNDVRAYRNEPLPNYTENEYRNVYIHKQLPLDAPESMIQEALIEISPPQAAGL